MDKVTIFGDQALAWLAETVAGDPDGPALAELTDNLQTAVDYQDALVAVAGLLFELLTAASHRSPDAAHALLRQLERNHRNGGRLTAA